MNTITIPAPVLTVADLMKQGYTQAHAEGYVAMVAQREQREAGVQERETAARERLALNGSGSMLPPPNFYPADGPRYADQPPPAVAQRQRRKATTGRPALPPIDEASPAVIRAWAASAGVSCNSMGRVPASVRSQYEAARKAGARI